MRRLFLLLILCLPFITLNAQTSTFQLLGVQGGIVRPAGDSTLSNIILGSGVTPGGNLRYTKDVYLVQPATGAARQLTTFDDQPNSPGVTGVAVSPNASTAAYIATLVRAGRQKEEVHVVDVLSGNDRLIATDLEGCIQPLCANCYIPCLHDLHFSLSGAELIWSSSRSNPFFVANVDGSGVVRLPVPAGQIANSPNVLTGDGRLVFIDSRNGSFTPYAVQFDGTGTTPLPYGPVTSDLVVSADGHIFAWQYATSGLNDPVSFSVQAASMSANTVSVAGTPYTSLAISSDGLQFAFVNNRQAWTTQQVTNFQFSDVLDVALNAAGSKILYSTAEINSGQRAAVWIADASGANARVVFGPGSINPNGVIGINSQGLPLALSPGSYFTIYGQNLHGKDELVISNIPVAVFAGSTKLPLQALTPWQVNAFLPMSVPSGPVTLSLTLEDGKTLTYSATVNQTAPALITYPDSTGRQQAAAFHLSTLIPCDSKNPARANEVIETYGFGLGITDPVQAAGAPAPLNPLAKTVVAPAVTIGTRKAQILYSGLVPSVIGVYQVNILTPSLAAGDYPMSWSTADQTPVSQGNFSVR